MALVAETSAPAERAQRDTIALSDTIIWRAEDGTFHEGKVNAFDDGGYSVIERIPGGETRNTRVPRDAPGLGVIGKSSAALPAPDAESVLPTSPLSKLERERLKLCESAIEQGGKMIRMGVRQVGEALGEVRDARLYREAHGTFEAYVQDRWKISRPYAYQLISAAAVHADVSAIADISWLPANEAQTRPLAPLTSEQRQEAARIVDQAAAAGERVTAELVQQAANRVAAPETSATRQENPPETKQPAEPPPFPVGSRVTWTGDGGQLGGLFRRCLGEVTGLDPDGTITVEGLDDVTPATVFVQAGDMARLGFTQAEPPTAPEVATAVDGEAARARALELDAGGAAEDEQGEAPAPAAVCRKCSCTQETPCVDGQGQPCGWAEPDLCTACASAAEAGPAGPLQAPAGEESASPKPRALMNAEEIVAAKAAGRGETPAVVPSTIGAAQLDAPVTMCMVAEDCVAWLRSDGFNAKTFLTRLKAAAYTRGLTAAQLLTQLETLETQP